MEALRGSFTFFEQGMSQIESSSSTKLCKHSNNSNEGISIAWLGPHDASTSASSLCERCSPRVRWNVSPGLLWRIMSEIVKAKQAELTELLSGMNSLVYLVFTCHSKCQWRAWATDGINHPLLKSHILTCESNECPVAASISLTWWNT